MTENPRVLWTRGFLFSEQCTLSLLRAIVIYMNNINTTNNVVDQLGAFVIDLDTGTIVGTNVVLVLEADLTEEELKAIEDGDITDQDAFDIGQKYGKVLYTAEGA